MIYSLFLKLEFHLKAPRGNISLTGGQRDPQMPSCLFTGVYHLNSWSFKGDNHHKDSVISFLLTSSRYRLNTRTAESRLHNTFTAYISKNLNLISKNAAMLAYS